MTNRYEFQMLIWALCLMGCVACAKEEQKKERPIPSVQVTRVLEQPASRSLEYAATLRGSVEVRVFSQVPDRIRALSVEEGDRVRKGQLIAVISHDVLASGLDAALAGVNASRANLDSLRNEQDRIHKLYKAQAVGEAQRDRIDKQVESAEAALNRLQAMVSQATSQQSKAYVRSPIDGVIGERYLEQGDMAAPGLPIVTVVQLEQIKAELQVPEFELPWVEGAMRKGYPVWVRVAGLRDEAGEPVPIPARLQRISPTIDLATRMATVEIRIDNHDRRLKPGMLAEVEVVVQKNDHALLIPGYAVINEGQVGASGMALTQVVYVVEDGLARRKPVRIGMRLSASRNGERNLVEIVEGLSTDAQVVTRGQHLLRDGERVEVIAPDVADSPDTKKKPAPAPKREEGAS